MFNVSTLIYEEYAGHLHGNQRYIRLLAENLRSSLTVLLPFRAELALSLEDKTSMHVLPSPLLWRRPFSVARLIRKARPNVLMVNNERSFLIAALGARLTGVHLVWYVKNFRASLFVDLTCFLLASRVLTIAPQCVERKGWVAKRFARKVHHLPIGIPLDQFLSIPEPKSQREELHVLMLGAITPAKGINTAVDAIRLIQQEGISLKLHIAGATPAGYEAFAGAVRREASDLPIEWLGWQADVVSLIEQSDVVILPSFSEGVPRSLVEAMAAARPVVATSVGGIPSIIEHGKNGVLIDVGDAEGLASALVELADNPEMRRKMGCVAREYAVSHHNFSNHVELLKGHLQQVVSK